MALSVLSAARNGVACFRTPFAQFLNPTLNNIVISSRNESHKRVISIIPSRWQWIKFRDILNFYFWLGVIPLTALVFYVDVTIGPAELAEIPEGYKPLPWEYYKHPISRWLAKNVYQSHQEQYEKRMHYVKEETDKIRLRLLERKIKSVMANEGDYQQWYYRPVTAKYIRQYRRRTDEGIDLKGEA